MGSLIPIPVVGTAAGLAVGTYVGYLATEFLDANWEPLADTVGSAVHGVASAAEAVGSAARGVASVSSFGWNRTGILRFDEFVLERKIGITPVDRFEGLVVEVGVPPGWEPFDSSPGMQVWVWRDDPGIAKFGSNAVLTMNIVEEPLDTVEVFAMLCEQPPRHLGEVVRDASHSWPPANGNRLAVSASSQPVRPIARVPSAGTVAELRQAPARHG